jgi:lysophospholipase L1-like esterase
MKGWIIGLVAGLAWIGATGAQDSPDCAVASHLAYSDYPLARVAAAMDRDKHVNIAVVGTGSSMLPPTTGANLAYPDKLSAALESRMPGIAAKVVSYAKMGQTTAVMVKDLDRVLGGTKPDLVIWQAGTVDAMRGIDPDDFMTALEKGVGKLRTAGTDVILMNMQYSPRTESTIAIAAYAENMRVVAQQREVPLFDRLAIMKHWSEFGTFDFFAEANKLNTAIRVHDCIAQLLADVIIEGVKASRPERKVLQ